VSPVAPAVPLPVDPVGADDTHDEPLEVRTWPEVPGATVCKAPVPLPTSTFPTGRLSEPEPPLATGSTSTTSSVKLTDLSLICFPVTSVRAILVSSLRVQRKVAVDRNLT
jgi:hypothetical protein